MAVAHGRDHLHRAVLGWCRPGRPTTGTLPAAVVAAALASVVDHYHAESAAAAERQRAPADLEGEGAAPAGAWRSLESAAGALAAAVQAADTAELPPEAPGVCRRPKPAHFAPSHPLSPEGGALVGATT